MGDLQQAIYRLRSSSHYQKLATYKPPFDPFEVMGVPYRELSHSKVLSWLLSDEANKEFRQKFVSWIVKRLDNNSLAVGADEHVDVRLEYGDDRAGRADVFAYFNCLKLAVAIEVKIRAGEQDGQIERYQRFLKRNYAVCNNKAVIFLTPFGDSPNTDNPETCVPVLNMSWDIVASMIDNMQPEQSDENNNDNVSIIARGSGEKTREKHLFRIQFRRHLGREIVMNKKEEKQIVRDLLREGDNARTMQTILDNLPSLEDFSEQWKKIVSKVCGVEEDSLEFKTYAPRGSAVKELKITVPRWRDAGLPFTLILYKYQNAGVRLLLRKEAFEKYREKLEEFAESSNGIVNDKFPSANEWTGWHAVLTADGSMSEPPETVIDAENFYHDENWKEQVEEKLKSQMTKLHKPIRNWLKERGLEKP